MLFRSPGHAIEVVETAAYRGTVTVRLDGRELVLGTEAARRIWVR